MYLRHVANFIKQELFSHGQKDVIVKIKSYCFLSCYAGLDSASKTQCRNFASQETPGLTPSAPDWCKFATIAC